MTDALQSSGAKRSLGSTIARLLELRAGEVWPVGMLLVHSFFHGIGTTFLETSAKALFLDSQPIENLATLYVGAAAIVVATGYIYGRVQAHMHVRRFLPLVLLFSGVSVLLFGLAGMMGLRGDGWYFALVAWFYVISTLVQLEFMTLPSLLFDIRQQKRLLGLLGSGEIFGATAGYLLVPAAVTILPVEALISLSSITFVAAAFVVVLIMRRYRSHIEATHEAQGAEDVASTGLVRLMRERYTRLLAGLTIFSMGAFYLIEFVFMRDMQVAGQGNPEQIAAFIGLFSGLAEGLNFILKTFFSGRFVNKFGVRVSLVVLPAFLLVGSLGWVTVGWVLGLSVIARYFILGNKFVDTIYRTAVHDPGFQILFQPLRPKARMAAQTMSNGIMDPLTQGWVGLLLVVLYFFGWGNSVILPLVVVGCVGGWIFTTVSIYSDYTTMLLRAMKGKVLDGVEVELDSQSARAVLHSKLESDRPGEVIYALDMLEQAHDIGLPEALMLLANHTNEDVRLAAIDTIGRLKVGAAMPLLVKLMINGAAARVRAGALRAYCALYEEEAVDRVSGFLSDPDAEVRRGAMTGLLRYGGIDGILAAADPLMHMATSADTSSRQEAAQIIGDVGVMSFYRPLRDLLHDASPEVQVSALQAASRIRTPRLLPSLIESLGRSRVHTAAAGALASLGEQALGTLAAVLDDERAPDALVARAARVVGRIRGEQAAGILSRRRDYLSQDVRMQVLRSLSQIHFCAVDQDRARFEQDIALEVEWGAHFLRSITVLNKETDTALVRALSAEGVQLLERVFYLLSFLYQSKSMLRARDNLGTSSRDHRAFAMELLDTELAPGLKRLLFPLIEDHTPQERIERLAEVVPAGPAGISEHLRLLITAPDPRVHPWTKACAISCAATRGLRALIEDIARQTTHPARVVREAALSAMQILDPERFSRMASAVRASDPSSNAPIIDTLVAKKGQKMLLTIEKAIILKTVGMFAETPDNVLSDVAAILTEEEYKAGERIIKKGDPGSCMYVIHEGKVRVHDGDITFVELGPRSFVGQWALLDGETRSADVTAIEDTTALRLDQEALYELMADRVEVARGIIRELTKNVRKQNETIAELKNKTNA
jgi:AAA family ATP:ADP antiporter